MRRLPPLAALALAAACEVAPLSPAPDLPDATSADVETIEDAETTWDTCAGTGPRDALDGDVKLATDAVSLIDNDVWQQVLDDDPWDCMRHDQVEVCGPTAFGPHLEFDGVWFDVETTTCNWFTGRQTVLADVPAGSVVVVRLWHFQITRGEGDFTLALATGEGAQPLWDTTRPVPSSSGLIYERFVVPYAIPAGTPIWYHVSNHGANSWGLIEVSFHP